MSKNDRALFFCKSLSGGGAEKVCLEMGKELAEKGFFVDYITLTDDDAEIDNDHVRRLSLQLNNENNDIVRAIKLLFSLNKIRRFTKNNGDRNYRLITAHLPMSNFLAMLSGFGKRTIFVVHSRWDKHNKYQLPFSIYKFAKKILFGKSKIVTVSQGLRNSLLNEYNLNEKNVYTIYNPVNVEMIKVMAKEPIKPFPEEYFVHVGRFDSPKRQDRMVDIFYMGGFYRDYLLVFLGSGPKEQIVKNKVEKYGITERVFFLGWQKNPYKYIANASIYVCTSDWEGFPLSILEAFVCGTRVVSSNCETGTKEIMSGKYKSFLAEFNDINDYIEKINEALVEYPDLNNSIIEQCDKKNVISNYLEYYNKSFALN